NRHRPGSCGRSSNNKADKDKAHDFGQKISLLRNGRNLPASWAWNFLPQSASRVTDRGNRWFRPAFSCDGHRHREWIMKNTLFGAASALVLMAGAALAAPADQPGHESPK